MQKVKLLLIPVLLGVLCISNYGKCAFVPSKSRDSPGTKFIPADKTESFSSGDTSTVTTVSSPSTSNTLPPATSPTLSSGETDTTDSDSLEFTPTHKSSNNKKCSPGGYPCTPDIVKMKLRNNSMYTSHAYQEPTPCCSGVCQYEEGWIDATCE